MATSGELIQAVDSRYAAMSPPEWTDPHDGQMPALDEYERVSSDRRTLAPHLRTVAWLQALADLGVATIQDADGIETSIPSGPGPCTVVVRAGRRDTLPLCVTTGTGRPTRFAVVDPQLEVDLVPSCGCDACDAGSDPLVTGIDGVMEAVVGGTLTVTQDRHRRYVHRHRYSGGGGTHGLDDPLTGHWEGAPWVD